AWALLAFHAAGTEGATVERAVNWLADTQRDDGSWDEPYFTGTGFPGDFYLNYHLYRQVFPVMALGRVLGENDGLRAARVRPAPARAGRTRQASRLEGSAHRHGAGAGAHRGRARARRRRTCGGRRRRVRCRLVRPARGRRRLRDGASANGRGTGRQSG